MNFLRIVYEKLYYGFWNRVLPRKNCAVPESLRTSRNIFIYFDYEREFSGHKTTITDENILYLSKLLQSKSIRSTWFTVGKIIEKYTNSLEMISKFGHELGSHTFSHKAPLETSYRDLEHDFHLFNLSSQKTSCRIAGFHSPRGRWAYKMFNSLHKYKFSYDLVGRKRNEKFNPYFVKYWPKKQIMRLQTSGDDWPLYRDKVKSKEKALQYFIGLINNIKEGEIGGIGFHPWILFSDINILRAFEEFISYLNEQKEIRIETAYFFSNEINTNPKENK